MSVGNRMKPIRGGGTERGKPKKDLGPEKKKVSRSHYRGNRRSDCGVLSPFNGEKKLMGGHVDQPKAGKGSKKCCRDPEKFREEKFEDRKRPD